MEDQSRKPATDKTIIEVIEVAGGQLIDKVKDLVNGPDVRTLRIKAGDDFSLEMPITVGWIAGGVVVLAAPWLAVLGVIAAMVTKVRIEVERDARPDQSTTTPTATAPEKQDTNTENVA